MNKRTFLRTLGLFSILPGAGRVWKAIRADEHRCIMLPPGPEHILRSETCVFRCTDEEYRRAFFESFFHGKPVPPHLLPPPDQIETVVLGDNLWTIGVRPT